MKKILLSFSITLMAAIALVSCGDGDRIDQKGGLATPQKPTIVNVKSVPGGAVVKVSIPDDPYIKGVVATYVRNGATVESRISRYLDTLEVKGYADLAEHEVNIQTFNADDEKSEGQVVKFTPQEAPVKTAKLDVIETFGGIKVKITNNPTLAKLALVIQCDQNNPDQELTYDQRKWKDVSTLFTTSDSVLFSRRGLESVPTVFAFHFRDDYGNVSETQLIKLTPKHEVALDKSKCKWYALSDDNFVNDPNGGGIPALFDGVINGMGKFFLAAKGCPIPTWFTIALNQEASISRIATNPRWDYMVYQSGNIREWEFWGIYDDPAQDLVNNPCSNEDADYNERHGFSRGWFLLTKGEQYKPSGYAPDGTVDGWTTEDREYYLNKTEYECDNTNPLTPRAFDKIRYLRVVVINTFDSWQYNQTSGGWFIGEISPYGEVYD